MNEQATVGLEKISVTVVRKTVDDLLVSQHSSERWFKSADSARTALGKILEVFVTADGEEEG